MKWFGLATPSLLIFSLVMSSNSYAEETQYQQLNTGMQFQVDYMQLNSQWYVYDYDTAAAQVKFIYPVISNMDVEGAIAVGISDDTKEISGIKQHAQLGSMFGIYLKAHTNAEFGTQIYGRLGLAKVTVDIKQTYFDQSYSFSEDDTGVAYGVGVSTTVANNVGIALEYHQLPDVNVGGLSAESTALSLGVLIRL